jgi:hypothetical protein
MLTTKERLTIALVMSKSCNGGVEAIYQWVHSCTALADRLCETPQQRDNFLTTCGFDEMIGHYDWRHEMECVA